MCSRYRRILVHTIFAEGAFLSTWSGGEISRRCRVTACEQVTHHNDVEPNMLNVGSMLLTDCYGCRLISESGCLLRIISFLAAPWVRPVGCIACIFVGWSMWRRVHSTGTEMVAHGRFKVLLSVKQRTKYSYCGCRMSREKLFNNRAEPIQASSACCSEARARSCDGLRESCVEL